ncbi:MAG: ActS/PrrB/RegB family redox-sensitive histidine kinase [Hyphomicrobiales bacterium]|nr:ActS/PrrB/RegB family redox-sensitive histidine kinase [Hyphomicrobiales bacterium]
MIPIQPNFHHHEVLKLRLETLIRIRWLAILGQFSAVMFVAYGLQFQFNTISCLAVIACSIFLNIFLHLRYSANFRVGENAVFSLLAFDIMQLAFLLYLTGGLENPFSLLLIVPVIISAATQSRRQIVLLGILAVISISFLAFFHLPLPWYSNQRLEISLLLIVGTWLAIIAGLIFTAIYAYRLADESRKQSNALMATEMILQREQFLSSLDGLAAAAAHELGTPLATIAVVSKEMIRELPENSPLAADAHLLRSQASRCRDILQKLTSLHDEGMDHIGKMTFASLIDEIVEPHLHFGIKLKININNENDSDRQQPVFVRNPATMYGLGNLVENAVDFAKSQVEIDANWDKDRVIMTITDDGKGYPREMLRHIGEPYVSTRDMMKKNTGGGLGLGLFIAKTLLERSGAQLEFASGDKSGLNGAKITVTWPLAHLERQQKSFKTRELAQIISPLDQG